jgi:O-antigen/teichoic acid export membrane protein
MRIPSLLKHNLITSSAIVVVGSFSINLINYLFNLVMGRLLNPIQYGELIALFGLVAIIGVPATTISILMAKHISKLLSGAKPEQAAALYALTTRLLIYGALGLLAFYWLITPFLARFLAIDLKTMLLFGLTIPFMLLSSINSGSLQGLRQFIPYTTILIIQTLVKSVLGTLAVIAGYSINGVIGSLVIGSLLAYCYGYLRLKKILRPNKKLPLSLTVSVLNLFRHSWTIFTTTLFLALLNNLDVTLAKHYLIPVEAGQYAALSVIGKIILYISAAFITVSFPYISSSIASNDQKEKRYVYFSLLATSAISGISLTAFSLMPLRIVTLLLGWTYAPIAPYLASFALAMFLFNLSYALITFFMAGKSKTYLLPLALAVFVQIIMILIWHHTIVHIITAVLVSNLVLIITLTAIFLSGYIPTAKKISH